MKKAISILALVFTVFQVNLLNANWDIKEALVQKVFIENKGQFTGKNNLPGSDVKYVIDNGARVFFTPKGLTYQMAILEEVEGAENMKIEDKMQVNYAFIHMDWVGANPAVKIVAENKVSDYYTYPDNKNRTTFIANAYKKITYKNLYPNIDVEYVFHAKEGIKYNIILHPGANPSVIKMKYTSTKTISTDKDGNIRLASIIGDVVDHAPVTFYDESKQSIASSFSLDNNTVSFNLDAYDNTKKVVIDPWTTNPGFLSQNKAYNITKDPAGNIYSTGGTNPFYLKKFNPGGTLLWTFTLPNATNWSVDNVVDPAGNSYLAYGAWQGNVNVKVNTAGVQVFNNTAAQNGTAWSNGECYAYVYSCTSSKLFAGGMFYTGGFGNGQLVAAWEVNQTNGNHFNHQHVNANIEIRSMREDENGDLYALTCPVGTGNTAGFNRLIKMNQALANVWNVTSGYMITEAQQGYYQGYCCNGFNGVAIGCYVYTTDGLTIKKWDKATGAQIGAGVNIPGGQVYLCSGMHVDVCGNLYAGSTTGVYKYDQNLVQLSFAPTTGSVYDICDGNIPGEIIASGNGFISSINMNVCNTMSITTSFTAPSACGMCDAVASATSNACSVTYSWSTGALTPTVGNLCPGIYTVYVSSPGCGAVSTASTVTVTGNLGFSITATPVDANCSSATGTVTINTATGVPTYTLQQNGTTIGSGVNFPYDITGLAPGTYSYFATAANGCTAVATTTVNFLNTLTVTPTGTNVLCFGGTSGSASVAVTGGSGNYVYNWTNGANGSLNSGIPAGIYSVTVIDGACTRTGSVQIVQPPALSLTVNSNTPSVCAGLSINANAFAAGGTPPYNYTWTPGPTTSFYNVTETVPGNYVYNVNVLDANGCAIAGNIGLTFNPIPVIAATSQTICYGEPGVLTVNGANSYIWMPGNYTGNTYTTIGTANQYFTIVGSDPVTGCSSAPVTATLVVNPLPTPQIMASKNTGCVPLCMTFTVNNSSGGINNANWDFGDGSFASNLTNTDRCFNIAGQYTVTSTVTDVNGCISKTTHTLEAYPIPTADFNYSPLKPIVNNGEVTFTDASYNGNIAKWDWYFTNLPKPHSNKQNPTYVYTDAGTYAISLLVTTDHGCVDTVVKTIIVGEDYGIFVPNAFTPNGDGVNDVFQPKGFGITKYELRVFNRWGEQLMFTNDFDHGWDGIYKGKLSKEDTYIWKINLTNVFGKSHELSGHVTLMK